MAPPFFLPSLSEEDNIEVLHQQLQEAKEKKQLCKEWEATKKKQKEADDCKMVMALKRKAANDVRGRDSDRGRGRGMAGSKVKRRHMIVDDEDDDEEYEEEEVRGLNRRLLFWGVHCVWDAQLWASVALPWALTDPVHSATGGKRVVVWQLCHWKGWWARNDSRTEMGVPVGAGILMDSQDNFGLINWSGPNLLAPRRILRQQENKEKWGAEVLSQQVQL
ncbi:hypothetical protein BU17DRAFT_71100 [Hysterangium stoloniferum]|nr:hypothetical protein BU17DRAFT_71100 [Hysterangium stoloniferum]